MIHSAYGLLMLAGIVVSAVLWSRLQSARHIPVLVFVGGLIGAVLGAKIGYLLAELPFRLHEPNLWINVLVGRTILGGILGGYAGVEWDKSQTGYHEPTGDSFALVAPLGIALGRIGCFIQGCCLGKECNPAWYAIADSHGVLRYPATLAEAAFNLLFLAIIWPMYRLRIARGQLFHIYLIAYGSFRFLHEFLRDTPRIAGSFSPYQILALMVVFLGIWRFRQRAAAPHPERTHS